MIETPANNRRFILDMGWYLLGALIPMGVGFIKTPIFTRYFTPEEYGYLGIVTITFAYLSIFVYSWLSSCLWRYYNAYKNKNDLKKLYSNLFLIYIGSSLFMLLVAVIWYQLADSLLVKQLIGLSFIQFMIKEFIGLFLIIIRLEGKAVKYNTIHSARAVLSFVTLYAMAYGLHYRITSVLTSTIIIDLLVLLLVLLFSREGAGISVRHISKQTLKVLFKFGSVGLISNFFFLLITSSDRYIIAMFQDMATVGIYNQVYNISQLSIVALVTVFFNTINPKLNKDLELNFKGANKLIRNYLFVYLLFGLPVITYLCMFPRQIAFVLLGPEFRSGYFIMPYIFISSYFYGLFLFIEIKFKFADKLKNIVTGVVLASIINIAINFVMIPLYGYRWAAISTLIAYSVLVLYFYLQDSVGFFTNRYYPKRVLFFLIILGVQILIDYWIRSLVYLNIWLTIVEGLLFFLMYLVVNVKSIRKIKLPI